MIQGEFRKSGCELSLIDGVDIMRVNVIDVSLKKGERIGLS